jgi:hypothetical protein
MRCGRRLRLRRVGPQLLAIRSALPKVRRSILRGPHPDCAGLHRGGRHPLVRTRAGAARRARAGRASAPGDYVDRRGERKLVTRDRPRVVMDRTEAQRLSTLTWRRDEGPSPTKSREGPSSRWFSPPVPTTAGAAPAVCAPGSATRASGTRRCARRSDSASSTRRSAGRARCARAREERQAAVEPSPGR